MIWGGRSISGVYWYITCLLFAILIFRFLLCHFTENIVCKFMILLGGVAVIESNMISDCLSLYSGSITGILFKVISLVKSPGPPWNIDVSLLAIVYVAMGYYYKETIEKWFKSDCYSYNVLAISVAVFIVIFCCFNYREGRPLYYFDMKSVYYHSFFAAKAIPCAFGLILARLIYMLKRNAVSDRLMNTLAFLGQRTIPVMFMHIPLNTWLQSIYICFYRCWCTDCNFFNFREIVIGVKAIRFSQNKVICA